MNCYIKVPLSLKNVFIKGCLPSKIVFHQKLSSIRVVLQQKEINVNKKISYMRLIQIVIITNIMPQENVFFPKKNNLSKVYSNENKFLPLQIGSESIDHQVFPVKKIMFMLLSYTKNDAKRTRQHARIHRRLSSTKGCLPPGVVFH